MNETYDDRDRQDPQAREADLFTRLRWLLAELKNGRGGWAERLADVDADAIVDRQALSRLPVLRKSDLVDLQKRLPPFGGLNATEAGKLARMFVSPGPIFDPEGRGADWWGAARALHAAGFRPGDIVLNTFSYHMTPAGLMFESGAAAIGCAVIPAGPGNTADQLVAIEQFQPTAYVGVPDFLKILLDKGRESGRDVSSITKAMVSGASLPASLAAELSERGVSVRQCYGTADLGIVAYEDDEPGMAVNEDVILEILRPGTGDILPDGEVGEVTVTRLNEDYPLIRFATGDMSCLIDRVADEGRTARRIKGWMGRADQTAKIKGMFVRPEQVARIGAGIEGLGRLRLVVERAGEQDRMTLLAEHPDASLTDELAARLGEQTRLKGTVKIVPPGSLPNDGKVISDERSYG